MPGSPKILSVELEARSQDDALTSFHRKQGHDPRVLDIKPAV